MRHLFVVAALTCALSACQSTTSSAPVVASAGGFDASEAAFIKKTGTTTIRGHAFWRNGEGGTNDAAGEIIRLVPATSYAKARFAALYKGGRSVDASSISQAPADRDYADYTRTTRAESNGRFEFAGVGPGDYFVTAQIVFRSKDQYLHFQSGIYNNVQRIGSGGGAMYETITVTGKEKDPIKLVLTNER